MGTPKRITILGATGSVGKSTLDLINRDRDAFEVVALTADIGTVVGAVGEVQVEAVGTVCPVISTWPPRTLVAFTESAGA